MYQLLRGRGGRDIEGTRERVKRKGRMASGKICEVYKRGGYELLGHAGSWREEKAGQLSKKNNKT